MENHHEIHRDHRADPTRAQEALCGVVLIPFRPTHHDVHQATEHTNDEQVFKYSQQPQQQPETWLGDHCGGNDFTHDGGLRRAISPDRSRNGLLGDQQGEIESAEAADVAVDYPGNRALAAGWQRGQRCRNRLHVGSDNWRTKRHRHAVAPQQHTECCGIVGIQLVAEDELQLGGHHRECGIWLRV